MNLQQADIECIFNIHFNEAIVSSLEMKNGAMAFKYEVSLAHKTYMIKIYPALRSFIANKEYRLLKAIETSAVKAPRACFAGTYQDASYFIYEKIPGEELDFSGLNINEKNPIASQIAENIFQLSSIQYGRYGSLIEDEPSFDSWRSFLSHNIDDGCLNLSKTNLYEEAQVEAVGRFMLGRLDHIQTSCSGTVWSDLIQENIIVNEFQLSGFIDFEGCFRGDPLLSLGYLFAREGGSDFFKAMEHQFARFIPVNRYNIYFYALLRLLRISKYLLQPLPTGRERAPVNGYFKGIKTSLDAIML